jgi:hypothetical protein
MLLALVLACSTKDAANPDDLDGDGVVAADDCDDDNADVHPGADELCDALDNNCDGAVDEGLDQDWWPDQDGDGYGAEGNPASRCEVLPGFATQSGDCDDDNADIHPGADEVCNLIDDNCDGTKDDTDTTWYSDADGDGYGDDATAVVTCEPPTGTVTQGGDCDDTNVSIYPGAEEACNALDDDCDGTSDLGVEGEWHSDDDGDGYGHPYIYETTCLPPDGWVQDGSDCRPSDASAYPGADEQCNGVDDNCDDAIDEGYDKDGDGYQDEICPTGNDCDDSRGDVHPGAVEYCATGVDEDCDGEDPHCGYDGAYDLTTEYDVLAESSDLPSLTYMMDAGDVTGDGTDDVLAASYAAHGGYLLAGEKLSGNVTMSDVGTKHVGDGSAVYGAGRSVGMADVDGDGLVDLGFGAPYGSSAGFFVVYGPADTDTDLTNDYDVWFEAQSGLYAGHGGDMGDVNGDGVGDIVLGAYAANEGGGMYSGAGYVLFGPLSGDYSTDDSDAVLIGESPSSYTGRWVRAGGDHNGDGIGDILIAAPYASYGAASGGAVYLVYGPPDGDIDLGSADGTIYSGSGGAYLGEGRTFAQGDVDGDGYDDAAVGSYSYGGAKGLMSVVYGPASGDTDVTSADIVITGTTASSYFGCSPAVADMDEDGVGDLLVGASAAGGGTGTAYLFWSPGSGSYSPSDADATFEGGGGDSAGWQTAIGDLNGDGWLEIIVGAYGHTGSKGAFYAIYNYQ